MIASTTKLPPTHAALQHHLLEEVVADIDSYLTVWLGRIEALLAVASADSVPAGPSAGAAQPTLDDDRRQWEQERDAQVARIEEMQRRMTEAWEALESEQRDLHRAKQAFDQRSSSPAGPDSGGPAGRGSLPSHAWRAEASGESDGVILRDESVRQFQQLRRESRK